jgi:REP element-mobilizing transposase RayT
MDDADRRRFVETLGQVCAKTGWQVRAYVLMPNHFHSLVETPQPILVAGMKWLLGTYTSPFNRRHKLKTRPKGDSVKVPLAACLRAQTTMTVGWIAKPLAMGTPGYLNHLLYRQRKLGGE